MGPLDRRSSCDNLASKGIVDADALLFIELCIHLTNENIFKNSPCIDFNHMKTANPFRNGTLIELVLLKWGYFE